jgi:hypothetical protein
VLVAEEASEGRASDDEADERRACESPASTAGRTRYADERDANASSYGCGNEGQEEEPDHVENDGLSIRHGQRFRSADPRSQLGFRSGNRVATLYGVTPRPPRWVKEPMKPR